MKHIWTIVTYTAIAVIGVVVFFTGSKINSQLGLHSRDVVFEQARVLSVLDERLNEDPAMPGLFIGFQQIEVEVLSGEFINNIYSIRNPLGRTYNVRAEENMEIVVSIYSDRHETESVQVYSYKRSNVTWWLLGAFILCVIAVGRLKGLKSILSLLFTGIMIIYYLLPRILAGGNPIAIAISTAILAITAGFFILNGWGPKTYGAIAGTVAGVIIAGTLSYVSGLAANVSGLTMENSEQLMYVADVTGLQLRGLMFAAILVASLGAIMDVGMSVSSTISEVHRVDPRLDTKELFQAGMNVGKDIIGTMTNTLILVFAGGLLSIMLLISAYGLSYFQVSNMDMLSIEIIQALAGSIGIVLTVPITAVSAALLINFFSQKGSDKGAIKG